MDQTELNSSELKAETPASMPERRPLPKESLLTYDGSWRYDLPKHMSS